MVKNLHNDGNSCFSEYNDEELVICAKDNRNAVNELLFRYTKLIYAKSRKYANYVTDCDDLFQEGFIGLLSAVSSFDPGKNVSFAAYSSVCIDNRMKTLLRKGSKSVEHLADISDISDVEAVCDNKTPESVFLHKEYFSTLFNEVSSVLSSAELKVFNLYIKGESYRKISEKLGMTEKSVDNAMQRARRKIRAISQEIVNYYK